MEKAPTKPPVPYDNCVGVPISHLLTKHSILNGGLLRDCETDGSFAALVATLITARRGAEST